MLSSKRVKKKDSNLANNKTSALRVLKAIQFQFSNAYKYAKESVLTFDFH